MKDKKTVICIHAHTCQSKKCPHKKEHPQRTSCKITSCHFTNKQTSCVEVL